MIRAALALAARGVPVFPLNADKSPRTHRGFHDATTDEAIIRAWDVGWNDALIGSPPPEGVIVLDIDPRNGGDNTLALFPALPKTRTTETRSGGHHYWLSVSPELKLRGTLGPGVDVKRHGKGYVVIPPSPGYKYVIFGDPAPAPDWLIEELVVVERPVSECVASDAKFFSFQKGTPYGEAALKNAWETLQGVENGQRNIALNKVTFGLAQLYAGGELSRDAALDVLLTAAEAMGLSGWETRNTIESAWRAGERVPRQAPQRERV